MRKINKRNFYTEIVKGSSIGVFISTCGFFVGTKLMSESFAPVIASTVCLSTSAIMTSLGLLKSEIEDRKEEDTNKTIDMLKTLKYYLKEAKKSERKGEEYFTNQQIKLLNYTLDDDMIGLQEYVYSDEFIDDIEDENKDYEPVHINEKIIRMPKRR